MNENVQHPITTRENVVLQPQENRIIKCRINASCNHTNVITLEKTQRVKGLSVESSLYKIQDETLFDKYN